MQQRDARVAVRVVLDRRDLRGHAVLVATEVDDAVLLLVPAAAVTRGHAAVRVATARARLRLGERLLRLVAGDLREVGDGLEPATGAGGLALADRHSSAPEDLDASRPRRGRRWPASSRAREPQPPVRRLRLRLPLRLSVFTLVTCTPKIVSIAWRISILLASCGDDERVDVRVERGVRLLGHHRPDDDVAGVLRGHSLISSADRVSESVSVTRCAIVTGDSVGRLRRRAAEARDRGIERRLAEDEPVVDEHVVGVELVGDHDLHAVAEVAERLPHRFLESSSCGLSTTSSTRSSRSPLRAQTECARAARCASFVRGVLDAPVVDDDDLALGGAVGQRRAQARGGSSSWACAGGSRGAWGRAPHHRRASAANGSSPDGRGRCPSGATASRHRRRTSARVLVLCVPERAAASCAVTTWCMTAMFGSMPNSSSGTSTVPAPAPVAVFTSSFMRHSLTWLVDDRRFAALRTNTRPPLGPGTAPFTRRRPRSASPSTTSRFRVVMRVVAVLAGHLHALEHAGRGRARADRAGRTVLLVVTVRSRPGP